MSHPVSTCTRRCLTSRLIAGAATVFALCLPLQAPAHHSFSMFDREHPIVITGVVREFQWTNPHSWIQLVVTDAAGKQVEWSLEGGSPGILSRNGWKRASLKAGDKIKVEIFPLKDGSPGGSFVEITKADGSKLYYHG